MSTPFSAGQEPHEFSEAHATNFQIFLARFPNITFFSTDAMLAGINLANFLAAYKDGDINLSNNKIDFDPIPLSFIVDEYFKSYLEIFDWMYGVANPQGPRLEIQDLEPTDMFISALDNNKNPILTFKYIDIRPISLGQVIFNSQDEMNTVLTCDVTFAFDYVTYEKNPVYYNEET